MDLSRSLLLWCSENNWMISKVPQYPFVKRAVKRFMPGEEMEDAIKETIALDEVGISTVLTKLGENISTLCLSCSSVYCKRIMSLVAHTPPIDTEPFKNI